MIKSLTIKNFKGIEEQTYEFTDFDLLVGRNNSGKSTILQALSIWNFCINAFKGTGKNGSKSIQIILPQFTALPVPEFNLLWNNKITLVQTRSKEKINNDIIPIEIDLTWRDEKLNDQSFAIILTYQSPSAIYAKPKEGWNKFKETTFPEIVFVPPFSGLATQESYFQDPNIKYKIGEAQPGSVLRNLLLRAKEAGRFEEIKNKTKEWFGIYLQDPIYAKDKDLHIKATYKKEEKKGVKEYDIISGGSGFHQTLTLLAFLYGYKPNLILLDEPDAHLHVNLQKEILRYFIEKSKELKIQFLIATHAEAFINTVDVSQIISLMKKTPERIENTPNIIKAMASLSNMEIVAYQKSPYILYVEGESDERILRNWAFRLHKSFILEKFNFKYMSGGSKKEMKILAAEHFRSVQVVVQNVKQVILFDYDSSDTAFHPQSDNKILNEWKRKNIENYLFIPEIWKRLVLQKLSIKAFDLFTANLEEKIDSFFLSQNLTLPPNKTWKSLDAEVFKVVDGKSLLFEGETSLFHILREHNPRLELLREQVAAEMRPEEIHQDIENFFANLESLLPVVLPT